jgi:hypothetical protein
MLLYTAELKRPLSEEQSIKRAAVDQIIQNLGLERCANVVIGKSGTGGISGGQVSPALLSTVRCMMYLFSG